MTPRLPARRDHPCFPRLRGPGAALLVAAALLAPARAFALWGDRLTLSATEKIAHDDNVFRISKDADPATTIGSPSTGDTFRTTSVGMDLDVPASRQRFRAAYAWNVTRYDRFTDLDFSGYDLRTSWQWVVGDLANGELGYAENSMLASFASTLNTTPDVLRSRRAFFDGVLPVNARWRIRAGASGLAQRNSDPGQQANDVDVRDGEVVASYVTPARASLGLSARAEDGSFPNLQLVGGTPVDNAYRQYGAGIVADWPATGASRLGLRVDHVRRRYVQLPERDFDGNIAQARFDWRPTGKFSLTVIGQRDISPYELIRSSFVLVKGAAVRPALALTEKIEISGNVDYSVREYLGDPAVALGLAQIRNDRVRTVGVAASYRATRVLALQLSLLHESRSSNVAFGDYVVNVASLAARLAF